MASRGKMADDHGEAHRALFEECLAKLTVGGERSGFLTKEKYDEIVDCLSQWDSLEPAERKKLFGGAGYRAREKYTLLEPEGGEPTLIIKADYASARAKKTFTQTTGDDEQEQPALDTDAAVSHSGRVFDDLLKIH